MLTYADVCFKNQVLNVGHKYVVSVGDTVLKIARRFGTTETSLKFLNYHLGELMSSNISVGQELCIIANSCFGEVQSIWDKNPHVDESLERWCVYVCVCVCVHTHMHTHIHIYNIYVYIYTYHIFIRIH